MSDRFDELKGNIKRTVGDITNNESMEAEGAAEANAARAERKAKGAANQVKGSVQEGVGRLTGDEATEAQGTADRLRGESQQRG
jgi:uncharacterized protein YjbJ (UPF0337 family)